MKIKNFAKLTRRILYTITFSLIAYDIVIAVLREWTATISKQTMLLSERFIALPVMGGLLLAHFWYGKIGRKLFGHIPRLRYAIWIPIAAFFLIISVVGLFKDIAALHWLGDNLYLPAIIGQCLGILWWQEKVKA